jgi:hypothetical protein
MFDYTKVINSHTGKPYGMYMIEFLTRVYGYMVKHNFNLSNEKIGGEKSLIHDPEMTHIRHSLGIALRSLSSTTPTEDFIDKVLVEIDNIKLLYENKPTYKVAIQYPTNLELTEFAEYDTTVTTYHKPNSKEFLDLIRVNRIEKIGEITKLQVNG